MREPERQRMEQRTRRVDPDAREIADVHAFADQRVTELGQVDPDLMLASRFEAAFDQRAAREDSDRPDVRHGPFRVVRSVAPRASKMSMRATHSVAAIGDEIRLDVGRGDDAVRDGMVNTIDGVGAKLRRKLALRMG